MTTIYPNSYSFGNYRNYGNSSTYAGTPYNPNYNQNSSDDSIKPFITLAGLGLASVFIQKASHFLADKLMQGKEFTTPDNIKDVADKMLESKNLQNEVEVGYLDKSNVDEFISRHGKEWSNSLNNVAEGKNAFYADTLKLAVAPKDKPSLILHELGHAINAHSGEFMKFLQKSRGWAPMVPTALMFLEPMFQPKDNNKHNFIKDHAGLIGFGAFVPTIVEEGAASLRGIKAAKNNLKGLEGVKLGHLTRNYALAWGTYVLAGLGLGIAAKQSVLFE